MKKEFKMNDAEFQAICDISRDQTPVMFIGVWTGIESKQEKANRFWKDMAKKYGFVWDSVEPSAKGDRFFLATPEHEKTDDNC